MAICNCSQCGQEFSSKRSDAKWCPTCLSQGNRDRWRKYEAAHAGEHLCPVCGGKRDRRSTVCRSCRGKTFIGDKNPFWKGGRTLSPAGYAYVRKGTAPKGTKDPYIAEHKLVWEQTNGPLPAGYVVHHINGNKLDNRPENLAAMPRHRHHKEPREALRPYESRIRELEARNSELQAEVERLRK